MSEECAETIAMMPFAQPLFVLSSLINSYLDIDKNHSAMV
jgi:hypothetical protein